MGALIFGISTTVLREHPISYALDHIADAGFQSAEIWTWHLDRWPEDPREITRLTQRRELMLTLHAPAGEVNPIASDANFALDSQAQILASLELASELGAQIVTIHPGRLSSPDDSPPHAWKRLIEWVIRLDQRATQMGLRIGMELMERLPDEIFMLPEDATQLMGIGFQQVGLTIDIAHMNTHMNPVHFMPQLDPDWITHAHLSDNAPRRVHLPLGEGQVDLGECLAALERMYTGIVSIEGSVPGQGEGLLLRNMLVLRKLGYGL